MGSSSTNLVLSGVAYNNFVDTIKSDQTREQYKRCLVRFMRFLNITDIDNLMALAVTGQDSRAPAENYRLCRISKTRA
jgi:hypothetical protein